MAEKKITKRENFTTIMGILKELGKEDLVKVMEHEIDLIDNKTSKKIDDEKVKIDEGLKTAITEVLGMNGSPMTVTQIMQADPTKFAGVTNQKITHLLGRMVTDKVVVNTKEKKVSYFTLA